MAWIPTRLTGYQAQLGTSVTVSGVTTVTKIAGLQSVDFNPSVHMVNVSTVDDEGAEFFLPGTSTWNASGKLALVAGETSQQALLTALLNKAQLTLVYYPVNAGLASGAPSYTGACYVEDVKFSSGGINTQQSLDVKLQGAGPFTEVAQ